jgi:hypothetical protein
MEIFKAFMPHVCTLRVYLECDRIFTQIAEGYDAVPHLDVIEDEV